MVDYSIVDRLLAEHGTDRFNKPATLLIVLRNPNDRLGKVFDTYDSCRAEYTMPYPTWTSTRIEDNMKVAVFNILCNAQLDELLHYVDWEFSRVDDIIIRVMSDNFCGDSEDYALREYLERKLDSYKKMHTTGGPTELHCTIPLSSDSY